jgi:hypothetical protein
MISTRSRSVVARALSVVLAVLLAMGTSTPLAAAPSSAAELNIASDPPGASVMVDGEGAGVTPLRLAGLAPGEHRIRVAKDGYLENGRVVTLQAGERHALDVHLTQSNAMAPRAQVDTAPPEDEGGGGSKKWIFIGLGVAAVGAAAYLVTQGNKAPTAGTITASPSGNALQGATGVSYSASGASDPDGDPLTYSWNFGDGGTGSGSPFSHTFQTSGSFTVQVTVSDGKKSASASTTTTVRSLAGAWAGSISGIPFSFNLAHSGSNVTGNYSDADGPGTVSGTVSNPRAVRLTVNQPQFFPFTFIGNADESLNTITGTIEGFPFTMTRR